MMSVAICSRSRGPLSGNVVFGKEVKDASQAWGWLVARHACRNVTAACFVAGGEAACWAAGGEDLWPLRIRTTAEITAATETTAMAK